MRRIAIVVEDISRSGGTERAVVNMVNAVSSLEYQFVIISVLSDERSNAFFQLSSQADIVNQGYKRREGFSRFGRYLRLKRDLEKIIKKKEIDIIIGTGHQFNCVIALLAADVVKIGWEHFVYEAIPLLSRLIRRNLYKRLDKVILLTKSDKRKYSFIGYEKKEIIPNIVSFSCSESAELKSNRIIVAGRLEKIKALDSVIKVAAMVKKSIPDWKFDIFGDGNEKQRLLGLIKEYHLEGYVNIKKTTDNIQKEYLNSSMMLLTSLFEALPMVLIEAQSCGLPIVAFDCPNGPREIVIDGRNGYLIANRDEIAMAEKVIQLAGNEVLLKQYGKAAKADSKRFAQKTIAEKWKNVLDEL